MEVCLIMLDEVVKMYDNVRLNYGSIDDKD